MRGKIRPRRAAAPSAPPPTAPSFTFGPIVRTLVGSAGTRRVTSTPATRDVWSGATPGWAALEMFVWLIRMRDSFLSRIIVVDKRVDGTSYSKEIASCKTAWHNAVDLALPSSSYS